MCKGTVNLEEYKLLHPKDFHESIRSLYSTPIMVDLCIADEVLNILKQGIATIGHSCCGHGVLQSQVFIYPDYVDYARQLGYEVYEIHDPTWEKDRVEYTIKLKNGTQHRPFFGGRVHNRVN